MMRPLQNTPWRPSVGSAIVDRLAFWRNRSRSQILFGVTTISVILVLYTVLRFLPIIKTLWYSLHEWQLVAKRGQFILLHNYVSLLKDESFLIALKNTLVFAAFTTLCTFLLSYALSLLVVQRISFGSALYEFLYFIPVVISMVPVAVVWKWIYDPRYGVLNHLISLVGIAPKAWLLDPKLVMPSVIFVSVWKAIGFYLVIFCIGLKDIPVEYYEAAAIDGASWWKGFRLITMPLMKRIMLFALVWATIQNLNVFTQIYILTMSYGPTGTFGRPVPVIVFDIYNNAFKFNRMGYASAEAVILFIIVMIVSLIQFRLMRESE
jgi:multiple sugar transport system permease protein